MVTGACRVSTSHNDIEFVSTHLLSLEAIPYVLAEMLIWSGSLPTTGQVVKDFYKQIAAQGRCCSENRTREEGHARIASVEDHDSPADRSYYSILFSQLVAGNGSRRLGDSLVGHFPLECPKWLWKKSGCSEVRNSAFAICIRIASHGKHMPIPRVGSGAPQARGGQTRI